MKNTIVMLFVTVALACTTQACSSTEPGSSDGVGVQTQAFTYPDGEVLVESHPDGHLVATLLRGQAELTRGEWQNGAADFSLETRGESKNVHLVTNAARIQFSPQSFADRVRNAYLHQYEPDSPYTPVPQIHPAVASSCGGGACVENCAYCIQVCAIGPACNFQCAVDGPHAGDCACSNPAEE
ncbi:MAG TPA: hypothetical protein VHT91_03390 [Kofleriaceae bacterium]|jgi:hypothetical protein|nr:hypothetical protein [Kofleriaceae bacterium]